MTIEEYIERHSSPAPEVLSRLERESNLRMVHGRMCSGHVQGRLLKMLVCMLSPGRVLELGTFTGYSSICIAEGLRETVTGAVSELPRLITLEANDELEDFIREYIKLSGYEDLIELRIGDALKQMRDMPSESYDLIFMDADKRQYAEYYKESKRLLRPGGVIIADNTLWDGHVVENRKHDSQTEGIIRFNEIVAQDSDTEKVILPLRDGLTIIRKRNSPSEC